MNKMCLEFKINDSEKKQRKRSKNHIEIVFVIIAIIKLDTGKKICVWIQVSEGIHS